MKVTFHFKISCLASYFAVHGSPKREREKTFTWQWQNSKEKKRLKENRRQLKIGGGYLRS